jgi:hypothetical protein
MIDYDDAPSIHPTLQWNHVKRAPGQVWCGVEPARQGHWLIINAEIARRLVAEGKEKRPCLHCWEAIQRSPDFVH